jgi:hypothetical protein
MVFIFRLRASIYIDEQWAYSVRILRSRRRSSQRHPYRGARERFQQQGKLVSVQPYCARILRSGLAFLSILSILEHWETYSELVFTELILQILYWIYEIPIHSCMFICIGFTYK